MASSPFVRAVGLTVLLAVSPCLAQQAPPSPLDLDAIAFRGIIPGVSTVADVKTVLGEPTRTYGRKVLIYEPLSIYVEIVPEANKTEVAAVNLFLVPSPDVFGAASMLKLKGNPALAAELGAAYSFDAVKSMPGVMSSGPKGWEILHLSRNGRTASLAYDPETHELKQVALYNF